MRYIIGDTKMEDLGKLLEFPAYPFLTDNEYQAFFGDGVVKATQMLNEHYKSACGSCNTDERKMERKRGGWCCTTINCEFYSPKFDSCPIYEFRPVGCKVSYCEDMFSDLSNISRKDRAAFELLSNVRRHLPMRTIADGTYALPNRLFNKAEKITEQFERGKITKLEAKQQLKDIIQEYRKHNRFEADALHIVRQTWVK